MTANQPPAAPQYSPDGHYWWDGTAWQPVRRPAPQQPAPGAWGAAPQALGALAPSGPRPRRRILAVLLVGAVAVVALAAGAVGGLAGGRARSVPVGPTAVPAVPEDFPEVSQRYLPGLTVSGFTQTWQQQDGAWFCEEPLTLADGEFIEESEVTKGDSRTHRDQVKCETGPDLEDNPSIYNDAGVWVRYDEESQVREVELVCSLGPGSPGCARVFTFTAGAVFAGVPEFQQQASDWAAQNIDTDSFTVIGGVLLEMDLEGFLTAVPAP